MEIARYGRELLLNTCCLFECLQPTDGGRDQNSDVQYGMWGKEKYYFCQQW